MILVRQQPAGACGAVADEWKPHTPLLAPFGVSVAMPERGRGIGTVNRPESNNSTPSAIGGIQIAPLYCSLILPQGAHMRRARLFSYVVDHDTGYAPNPYFGFCTLCRCKHRDSPNKPRNIVERAAPGDWIVGTGGADLSKSAGHHKIVYAMKVEQKITRGEYFLSRAFACKKPSGKEGEYRARGDNLSPSNKFEAEGQFVLISRRHFYYFGNKPIKIPMGRFPHLEKSGPGFRSSFDVEYVTRFEKWMTGKKPGKRGNPCKQQHVEANRCKSSC